MTNTEPLEGGAEHRTGEGRPIVGEYASRSAVGSDGALENRADGDRPGPRHALERHQVAALVVDDSDEPDWEHAQHPDEGQVDAAQLETAAHVDAPASFPPLVAELNDELGPASENSTQRLAGGGVPQHPLRQAREVAASQLRLLDVQTHELLLDVGGRSVPRAAMVGEVVGHEEPMCAEPPPSQASHGAAEASRCAFDAALVLVDGHREAEQYADDGDAHRCMPGEQESHAGILLRAFRALLFLLVGASARWRAWLRFEQLFGNPASTVPMSLAPAYHWAVVVGDSVWDAFTSPFGLPVEDYLNALFPDRSQLTIEFFPNPPPP